MYFNEVDTTGSKKHVPVEIVSIATVVLTIIFITAELIVGASGDYCNGQLAIYPGVIDVSSMTILYILAICHFLIHLPCIVLSIVLYNKKSVGFLVWNIFLFLIIIIWFGVLCFRWLLPWTIEYLFNLLG